MHLNTAKTPITTPTFTGEKKERYTLALARIAKKGYSLVTNRIEAQKVLSWVEDHSEENITTIFAEAIVEDNGRVVIEKECLDVWKQNGNSLCHNFKATDREMFIDVLVCRWIRSDIYDKAMAQ